METLRPAPVTRSVSLHREHSMAGLRARAGALVRAVEARRREWVATAVRRARPARVLDVGCEDGWLAEAYLPAVREVVLVDRDPVLLASGRLAADPRVRTLVGDAEEPAALAAALGGWRPDLLVASALLEHLARPRAALGGLLDLLAPAGRALVYLPADRPILALKAVLKATRLGGCVRGLSLAPAPGHLHTFGRRAVAALLGGLGRVEEIAFDPLCLGYRALVRRAPAAG